ncbi:MAG: FlgD immunoglobulin-like domain containing protein [Candidatus Eisenbacteria bacterium]
MRLTTTVVIGTIAGLSIAGVAGAGTWDVTADWSDTQNPNGVWSYNAAVGDPLTVHQEDYGLWEGDPPQPAWAFNPVSVGGAHLPSFLRCTDDVTGGGLDYPLGKVFIHGNDVWNSPPEYQSERANVAWTSPIEGEVVIAGGIWHPNPGIGRDVDWEIWRNQTMLTSGTIAYDGPYSSDSMMSWSEGSGGEGALTLEVGIGDEVRLEILWNQNFVAAFFAGVDFRIDGTETGVGAAPDAPAALVLERNRPNPFNPTTTIRYGISRPSDVRLVVYDIAGRRVRTLREGGEETAGFHEVFWNGRDDSGTPVASGTYFYRLVAGDRSETKRMILVR